MKRNKLLLVSGVIGVLYLIYLISYFSNAVGTSDGAEVVGAGIATALVMPHAVVVGIAVIFNLVGFAMNVRWGALTAGILYAVSMVLMPIYFVFVVIEMILCFVAFAKMKRRASSDETVSQEGNPFYS